MGLSSSTRKALKRANYDKPSPIQAGLIPMALEDYDVVGQARTGTGKTAAFALPVIDRIDTSRDMPPQAIILAPTRELALQVCEEIEKLSHFSKVQAVALYGGRPFKRQANQLKSYPQIVVGTPGRVIDHIKRGTLVTSSIWCVVLDEADRMLDIGFRPDIEWILRKMPVDRQTLLLSATVPPDILKIIQRYMIEPKFIDFSKKDISGDTIDQYYTTTTEDRKLELLRKLIQVEEPEQTIVFCRTKVRTMRLHRILTKEFKKCECIHGDLSQGERNRVMREFRSGSVRFLVATDVMGRGIDVTGISHIINYDLPLATDDYVHRVGRTGRMGKEGVAFSFVTKDEGHVLTDIEKRINRLLKPAQFLEEEKKEPEPEKKAPTPRRRYRRSL